MSLQCLKKELSQEVDVLHIEKDESFYKLIVLFLIRLARHAQFTQVNLQYLCDISRMMLGT